MAEQTLIISPSFGNFVFDAVLNVEHTREVAVTAHPVQYGAEITDHSYMEPESVSLQIGMSDAMSEIGQANRSVNAYTQLVQMMESRELLTLVTRLGTYTDMLIVSMSAPDEFAVMNGFKAQIGLRHVNIVTARVVLIQNKVSSSKGGGQKTTPKEEEDAEDLDVQKTALLWIGDLINTLTDFSDASKTSGLTMSWDDYKNNKSTSKGIESVKEEYDRRDGGKFSQMYPSDVTNALNREAGSAQNGTTVDVGNDYYVKTTDGWKQLDGVSY